MGRHVFNDRIKIWVYHHLIKPLLSCLGEESRGRWDHGLPQKGMAKYREETVLLKVQV